MKRQTVLKIVVDILMLIFFVSMVFAQATGLVYHEIFGLVLGGLVLLHLFLNQKWIAGVCRGFSRKPKATKLKFILNSALVLFTLVIIITGIFISVILFNGSGLGNRPLLVAIHKFSTYGILGIIGIHLLLHAKYLVGVFSKLGQNWKTKGVRQVVTAAFALILLGFFAYNQISPILAGASTTTEVATVPNPSVILPENTTSQKEEITEPPTPTVEQATPAVTLNDYLSGLFCTGCSKHCPLISPQCGKGDAQAQEATVEYQSLYGDS